jgi:glycosyltransferase involved in cell wall biosynthesis
MNLAFAATNPCHLYPLAQAVEPIEPNLTIYMGYPRWRLARPHPAGLRCHSLRTIITYALLRVPERFRPDQRKLFDWQDRNFDRWVGLNLSRHDFIHAIPGQAIRTFRRARALSLRTVLNHATGPASTVRSIMAMEMGRLGLAAERQVKNFDQEQEEYALADYHCVASTVVCDQLVSQGVPAEKIWIIPYGASPDLFFASSEIRPQDFRPMFAGQIIVRKGIPTLLQSLELLGDRGWSFEFYGSRRQETDLFINEYRGKIGLRFHGATTQARLAEGMRSASVLVLPSVEDGFGLVVPQALACGTPCIVSDKVGAADLIRHRQNGSIFPVNDHRALADEISFWESNPIRVKGDFTWKTPARLLVERSREALEAV